MHTLSRLPFSSFLVFALSLTHVVGSASTCYKRELSVVGSDFFDEFNWETEDDPTHGRVNYLTMEEARDKNLTYGLSSLMCLILRQLTR